MEKINNGNIRDYISFLYKKRNNSAAPTDLLDKWGSLQPDSLQKELQGLYNHWGLDHAAITGYENEFVASGNVPKPVLSATVAPPKATKATVATAPPSATAAKPNNTPVFVMITVLLLGVVGFLLYKLNKKEETDTAFQPTSTQQTQSVPDTSRMANPQRRQYPKPVIPKNDTASKAVTSAFTEEDEQKKELINKLLDTEENEVADDMLSFFSPNLQQYYNISYPTADQLKEEYQSNWVKSSGARNVNRQFSKVSDRIVDLYATYTYYDKETETAIEVPVHDRYEFDDEGKITKVYKMAAAAKK